MQTLDEIKDYLDKAITEWRKVRDDRAAELNSVAQYYVDAFQSMRVAIFGELLP